MTSDLEVPSDQDDYSVIVCEFCGFEIEEIDQKCPALDEGVCQP